MPDKLINTPDIATNMILSRKIKERAKDLPNTERGVRRQKMENKISESEELFRSTFEQVAVGMAHISLTGQFIRVNRRFGEIVGYSRPEMLALSLRTITCPGDLGIDCAQTRQLLDGEICDYAVRKRCLRKDGSTVWVRLTMSLVRDAASAPKYYIAVAEDVSQYVIVEKALENSRQRYKDLWNNAPGAYHTVNSRGVITRVNGTELRMLGYAAKEMVGRSIFEFIPSWQRSAAEERFKRHISGYGTSRESDLVLIRKDGKKVHVSVVNVLERDGSNEIVGMHSTMTDITERQKLQNGIIEEKKHYKQVIDSIRDGICVIDRDHKIVSYNKSFAEKVKLPLAGIKGKYCHEVFHLYHHNVFKGYCAKNCHNCIAKSALKTGKTCSVTEKSRDENGRSYFHKILAFAGKPSSDGQTTQAVIAVRDVTLSKEAEEEIRRLNEFNNRILNNAPVSIVVLNKKGKIIAANELARRLMEEPEKNMVGGRLTDTKGIKERKGLVKMYDELLSGGKAFYYHNLSYVPKGLRENKYLNIIAVPLFDKRRQVDGAISMALDNTEAVKTRQKLEDLNQNLENKVQQRTGELKRINEKLSQILDSQSRFIGNASHELRTPLTVIQGNVELAMMEAKMDGGSRLDPDVLETILDEVESMSHILTDLTILTNIDAHHERVVFGRVELGNLAKGVCRSLKVLAGQKNIGLEVENEKLFKDISIRGDETKLEKLTLNIVRNAIKYTNPGGKVSIGVEKEDDREVRIKVKDTGVGIPAGDIPHIFDRFYRVDKSRSRSEGGSGLGLSIAKWIAEAHGGRISVRSALGKGSVFTIHLPLASPEKDKKSSKLYYYN